MTAEKRFLNAKDVAGMLECSKSTAYTIIRRLNDELAGKGCIIMHGKIYAKYFYERFYPETDVPENRTDEGEV